MGHPEHNQSPDFDAQALLAEADWVAELARRLTRDWQTAGDVAQGAMAIALEKRPSTYGGLRPWLSRVVSTVALQERRGAGRRKQHELMAGSNQGDWAPSAEDLVLRVEAQQKVAAAVCALPEPYREVVLRRYYQGHSCEAIAAERGQAASTVRSQLSRGLARLKDQLERSDDSRGQIPAFLWAAAGLRESERQVASATLLWPWALVAAGAVAGVWATAASTASRGEALLPLERGQQLASSTPTPAQVPTLERERVPGLAASRGEAFQRVRLADGVGIRLRITDMNGNLVPGAHLAWEHPDGGGQDVAFADASGYAELVPDVGSYASLVASGRHVPLLARAPGRVQKTVEWHPTAEGLTAYDSVGLRTGGSLTGRIVDAEGRPVEGALIVSARENDGGENGERGRTGPPPHRHRVTVRSRADGSFVCAGLEPGPRRLWLRSDTSLWTLTSPWEVAAGQPLEVGSLELEPAGADQIVSGVVTVGGLTVANAEVSIEALTQHLEARTRTDEKGMFRYAVPSSKPVAVVARHLDDTSLVSSAAVVMAGEQVELELQASASLEVHVVDASGHPLPGCGVRAELHGHDLLSPLGGGPQVLPGGQGAITGLRGVARLELPVGEHRLRAAAPGFSQEERLSVRMPGTSSVILRMVAQGARQATGASDIDVERIPLKGRWKVDGAPAPGWRVDVLESFAKGTQPAASAHTDQEGAFETVSRRGTLRLRYLGALEGRDFSVTCEHRHGVSGSLSGHQLRTGLLRLQLDRSLSNARLVLGHERTGRYGILSLGPLPAGKHTLRAPVGMLTLEERRTDGSWGFVGIVDVEQSSR